MTKFSKITSTTKAVVAAAILGATLFISSGAQAGSNFNGSFRIDLGNGVHFSINNGQKHNYGHTYKQHKSNKGYGCLTTKQALRGLRKMGFRNTKVLNRNGKFVKVRTTGNHNRLVLRVNKCSGKIAVLKRRKLNGQNKYKNNHHGNGGGNRVKLHY